MNKENLDIIYIPNFIEKKLADILFDAIKNEDFPEDEIQENKNSIMPRLIKWYGDKAYAYAHIYHPALQIPEYIQVVMSKINSYLHEKEILSQLNSVLINYYRDGKDKINYHSDDLTQIGNEPVIASVSLGDSRIFKFRSKKNQDKIEYTLNHGDLFIMKGETQDYWQHGIATELNKKARINLTFRNTLSDPQ